MILLDAHVATTGNDFELLGIYIGLLSAVIAALAPIIYDIWKTRAARLTKKAQKKTLQKIFSRAPPGAVSVKSLGDSVGADLIETRRLLLEIGAEFHGSPEGDELWSMPSKLMSSDVREETVPLNLLEPLRIIIRIIKSIISRYFKYMQSIIIGFLVKAAGFAIAIIFITSIAIFMTSRVSDPPFERFFTFGPPAEKIVILGVTDLSNQPAFSTLSEWWKRAMIEGLERNCKIKNVDYEFTLVSWTDLLYTSPLHSNLFYYFDTLYDGQPYVPSPSDSSIEPYRETFWESVSRYIMRYLLPPEWDLSKEQFYHDLILYYDELSKMIDRNGTIRVLRDVLKEEIADVVSLYKNRKILIVAHGLGGIVVDDFLRDLGREDLSPEIPVLVTIGTPLGLAVVINRILKSSVYPSNVTRVRTPAVISGAWLNFSDPKDPVNADPHLADDFAPNSNGVKVIDDLVRNDYVDPNGINHPGKVFGYLRTPEYSNLLARFLNRSCNATVTKIRADG